MLTTDNLQLLDEFEHDSDNYHIRGLWVLPKQKAEANNTSRGHEILAIVQKPNPI